MPFERTPCVYILASKRNGTLYIGVTSDLPGRIHRHRDGTFEGFSKRYDVKTLVWFEVHAEMDAAIRREKQLKKWERAWKIRLIEDANPGWRDLAENFGFEAMDRPGESGTAAC